MNSWALLWGEVADVVLRKCIRQIFKGFSFVEVYTFSNAAFPLQVLSQYTL